MEFSDRAVAVSESTSLPKQRWFGVQRQMYLFSGHDIQVAQAVDELKARVANEGVGQEGGKASVSVTHRIQRHSYGSQHLSSCTFLNIF